MMASTPRLMRFLICWIWPCASTSALSMTKSSVSPSCLYSPFTLCRSSIICVRHSLLMKPLETPIVNGPSLPCPPPFPPWPPPPQAATNTTVTKHTVSARTLPVSVRSNILYSFLHTAEDITRRVSPRYPSLFCALACAISLFSPRPQTFGGAPRSIIFLLATSFPDHQLPKYRPLAPPARVAAVMKNTPPDRFLSSWFQPSW